MRRALKPPATDPGVKMRFGMGIVIFIGGRLARPWQILMDIHRVIAGDC
ncbi:MAG: hypothetical protein AAF674_18040 [Pseudomonadota bacterium]